MTDDLLVAKSIKKRVRLVKRWVQLRHFKPEAFHGALIEGSLRFSEAYLSRNSPQPSPLKSSDIS